MTELAITKCIFENSAWVNHYKILTEKLVTCPRSSTHWLLDCVYEKLIYSIQIDHFKVPSIIERLN